MSPTNKLEIFFLYCSNSRGEDISFTEIVQQKNILDGEDIEPSNFWGISGGVQILVNNYNTVFRSVNFHYLVKATNFLIHSLYWIKGIQNDRFDSDDDYPNDVVVRTTSNELLRLRSNSEKEVVLSFSHSERNHIWQRGDRYFENIIINKDDWYNASKLALSEYFEVLLRAVQSNPNDSTSKTMMGYYEGWRNIENG